MNENKKMKIQFYNSRTGEVFELPTIYTDRVEACVCGQNYSRDRFAEDGTALFFRVCIVDEFEDEDDEVCPENVETCLVCPHRFKCFG